MGLVFADLFYLSVTQTIAKEDRESKKIHNKLGNYNAPLVKTIFSFSKLGLLSLFCIIIHLCILLEDVKGERKRVHLGP